MGQLKYYFKKRTANSPTETAIKNSFQKLYQANDYAIFETFWQNEVLRGALWSLLPSEPTLEDKNTSLLEFQNWVSTQDDRLFNFVLIR